MVDLKYLKWSDLNKMGDTQVSGVAESKSVRLSRFEVADPIWRTNIIKNI